MQPLVLDSARPQDVQDIVGLLGLLFSQEADFQPDPARQTRALTMILAQPAVGCIFVARVAGRVVGMVNLLFLVSTAEGGRVIQLEDFVVHPDFRGQGLGRQLLAQVLAFAQREHFSRITLLTDAHNADAQRFYLRHGFALSTMVPLRLHLNPRQRPA
jgi:GNAT superfamily N-acetyltransferase